MIHCLPDSNIWLRIANPNDPLYSIASDAIEFLRRRNDLIYLVPQSLYEFWSVSTRPTTSRGGLGLLPSAAKTEMDRLRTLFTFLPDMPEIFKQWEILVQTYGVSGVKAHDARLVAAMQVHGLTHILTFNADDFIRYPMITALHPSSLQIP